MEALTMGRKTVRPSCFSTRLYISWYPPPFFGKLSVYHAPAERYMLMRAGDKNGPKKLPMVDCTTVSASLPWAFLVIRTLKAILEGGISVSSERQ